MTIMSASTGQAPLAVICLAQALSAGSELLGQRIMQRCHSQSSVRMLISMSVYCALQATVVLGAAELLLPSSVTGGQGPISMWLLLMRYPGLWLNALVNGLYLLSITVLLREATGPLYVVFAFLIAAVLLGVLNEGARAWATWAAALLGATGAAFVLWPRDSAVCSPRWTWRALSNSVFCASTADRGERTSSLSSHRNIAGHGTSSGRTVSDEPYSESETAPLAHDAGVTFNAAEEPKAVVNLTNAQAPTTSSAPNVAGLCRPVPLLLAACWECLAARLSLRNASVAAAFVTLALTAAAGITLATHYQRVAGLNGMGYTAIDQVLLPLVVLPLAAALDRSRTLRVWIGEPPWSPNQVTSPSFSASIKRAAAEVFSAPSVAAPLPTPRGSMPHTDSAEVVAPVNASSDVGDGVTNSPCSALCCPCSPWRYVFTLIPYHGLEFLRSFLLFFLVTRYELDATYLQMTLVRVVLCWCASLLACTLLREWVGVPRADAEAALSPMSLAGTCVGAVLMLCAIAILRA